jgi:hypothetical protein
MLDAVRGGGSGSRQLARGQVEVFQLSSIGETIHGNVTSPCGKARIARYDVTGVWDYTMRSNLDQRTHTGSLHLTMNGETVSGTMRMWDKTDSAVNSTFKADSLSFVRETGMQGTIQFFDLKRVGGKRFAGTFRNEGSVPDNGTITIAR